MVAWRAGGGSSSRRARAGLVRDLATPHPPRYTMSWFPPPPRADRAWCAALAASFLAVSAYPHGGVYRGPGSGLAPAPTPGGPGTAGPGAPGTDAGGWSRWWGLNRDLYLNLKAAVHEAPPSTGGDDFFLGRGEASTRADLRPSSEAIRERVVPALISVLESESNADLVTGSLLALAKIGDGVLAPGQPSLAESIQPFLAHPNQEIHESAAVALGVLAEPSSATLLVELLHDTRAGAGLARRERVPLRTRAYAAFGLGQVGHRATSEAVRGYVVHHLSRALELELPRPDVAVAAVLSMGLVRLQDGPEPDPEAPQRASRSRQAQMRALFELFDSRRDDHAAAAYVPVALARLSRAEPTSGKEELARRIVASLEPRAGRDVRVQHGAIHAAGLVGDDDADEADAALRGALFAAAREGDALARHLALIQLARVAGRPGAGAPSDAHERTRAFLLERLARSGTTQRAWAGLALGLFERDLGARGARASEEVRLALRASRADAASTAESGASAIALGLAGDREAVPALIERLDGGDESLRADAAIALGLIGAREAIGPLRAIVETARHRPGLMRECAIALGLLGDKETVPLLVERLGSTDSTLEQSAIASALGFVGDSRAIDPLLGILLDTEHSDTARAFAAVALGLVCDKEAVPWNSKLAADAGWWEAPATLLDPTGGKGVLDLF